MSTEIIHCNGHTTKLNLFKVMFRTPRKQANKNRESNSARRDFMNDHDHRHFRTVLEDRLRHNRSVPQNRSRKQGLPDSHTRRHLLTFALFYHNIQKVVTDGWKSQPLGYTLDVFPKRKQRCSQNGDEPACHYSEGPEGQCGAHYGQEMRVSVHGAP